jgi:hypothetical protein
MGSKDMMASLLQVEPPAAPCALEEAGEGLKLLVKGSLGLLQGPGSVCDPGCSFVILSTSCDFPHIQPGGPRGRQESCAWRPGESRCGNVFPRTQLA